MTDPHIPRDNPSVGDDLIISRRRLPHHQRGGATYWVTLRIEKTSDRVPHGMQPLSREERAYVKEGLLFWHEKRWHVHYLVVMPDHVHLLATPFPCGEKAWHSLPELLHRIKTWTARRINEQRGERGPVWQTESYDRIIGSDEEFQEKAGYLLENPVRKGLAEAGWRYDGFWCDGESFWSGEEK